MDAAIIAVGSELLGSSRPETNSLRLARVLEHFGVNVVRKSAVGDDVRIVSQELLYLLHTHDVVLITGGLGPTEDDITKEAVAQALGLTLREDDMTLRRIQERFAKRHLVMPETNRKQALVFEGQKTIANQRGTAPGFHLNVVREGKPKHVWIFPGVPYELEGMIEHDLTTWLQNTGRAASRHQRIVKLVGITESGADEQLKEFYRRHSDLPITILASSGEIHILLTADGSADQAFSRLTEMEQQIRDVFGEKVYGLDDETLERVVGRLLASRGETVATAESCTGGLLASRLTDVSGSSAYFLGGVVAYSGPAKMFLLGVDPELMQQHGEVSEEVAEDLARGARRRFGTTFGIGITGIAGPTGGSAAKPVGTVHVAVESADRAEHRQQLFTGSRESIKWLSTQAALNLLRLMLIRE